MRNLCIKSDGICTHVFLDGKEIVGIQEMNFHDSISEVATLDMKMSVPFFGTKDDIDNKNGGI